MKKLIFAFLVFSLFACDKTNDEIHEKELDPNENWIEYFDLTPQNGSIITKPTTISATVKYNISPNELEVLGFYISLWSSYGINGDWYSSPALNAKLSTRSGEALVPFLDADQDYINRNKGGTISYRIAITRKFDKNRNEFLIQSEPISYSFE